jgi:hypothetical protein
VDIGVYEQIGSGVFADPAALQDELFGIEFVH